MLHGPELDLLYEAWLDSHLSQFRVNRITTYIIS